MNNLQSKRAIEKIFQKFRTISTNQGRESSDETEDIAEIVSGMLRKSVQISKNLNMEVGKMLPGVKIKVRDDSTVD